MPRSGVEKKPGAQPSYTWATIRSECSVSCGGGKSYPMVDLVMGTEVPGIFGPWDALPWSSTPSPGPYHMPWSPSHALVPITQPGPHHGVPGPHHAPWSSSQCTWSSSRALVPITHPGPHHTPWSSSRCTWSPSHTLVPITHPGPHHGVLTLILS